LVGERKNGDPLIGDPSPPGANPRADVGEFGEKRGPSVPGKTGVGSENGVMGFVGDTLDDGGSRGISNLGGFGCFSGGGGGGWECVRS
jgi:hypothetical protein